MMYLLDTVAIIRHFSGSENIGKRAKILLNSIENSENVFAISIISLIEIMYLVEKQRINIRFNDTLNLLRHNSAYKIIELNTEIIIAASNIKFYELHDRMILATVKWLEIPVLSSDRKFLDVDGIEVIWN